MMIPYMVGKLLPNSSHLTRGLVKHVPGRRYFRTVSSQNGDKFVTSSPPPPIVERVEKGRWLLANPSRPPEWLTDRSSTIRHTPVIRAFANSIRDLLEITT